MNNWRTIAVFYSPSDLLVLETKLKSEDIEYRIFDKLTTEIHPHLAGAMGGIRLQVKEEDYHDVAELLIDAGIRPLRSEGFPIIYQSYKITSKIPLLNRFTPELQFIMVLFMVIVFFVGLLLLAVGI